MDLIYIGEIVNTHGIKGELRIISNFKLKEDIFKKGFNLYVGRQKEKQTINTYRKHKNYDMVTFVGIDNINDVLIYKGDKAYIDRNDLKKDVILNEDLIGFDAIYNDHIIGQLSEIANNNAHDILIITKEEKRYLVPFIKEFIKDIDVNTKKIYINELSGLIDEN